MLRLPQISNIRIIKEAMREASFLYAELVGLGAPLAFADVGGGLAIDYEARRRLCPSVGSMHTQLREDLSMRTFLKHISC